MSGEETQKMIISEYDYGGVYLMTWKSQRHVKVMDIFGVYQRKCLRGSPQSSLGCAGRLSRSCRPIWAQAPGTSECLDQEIE